MVQKLFNEADTKKSLQFLNRNRYASKSIVVEIRQNNPINYYFLLPISHQIN